jgi:hypothetical protein
MTYIPEFDLDAVISTLDSISQRLTLDTQERDAIELAQIALLYTRHIRRQKEFATYYKEFFDPSFKVKIAHEFATQAEADAWISSGSATEAARVKIAGKGFQVAQLPTGRLMFIHAPFPQELEKEPE